MGELRRDLDFVPEIVLLNHRSQRFLAAGINKSGIKIIYAVLYRVQDLPLDLLHIKARALFLKAHAPEA